MLMVAAPRPTDGPSFARSGAPPPGRVLVAITVIRPRGQGPTDLTAPSSERNASRTITARSEVGGVRVARASLPGVNADGVARPKVHDGANPSPRPYPRPRPGLVPCDPTCAAQGRALPRPIVATPARGLLLVPTLTVAIIEGEASTPAPTLTPALPSAAGPSRRAREARAGRAIPVRPGDQAPR